MLLIEGMHVHVVVRLVLFSVIFSTSPSPWLGDVNVVFSSAVHFYQVKL